MSSNLTCPAGGEGRIPFLRKATIKYFRGCRPTGTHGGCRVPPAHCQEPPFKSHPAFRRRRWDSFSAEKPRRLQSATGTLPRAAFQIPPSLPQKNTDHPNGWSVFWRRRWDSNPRGVLPPTRFRVFYSQHTLADFEKKYPILMVNALVRKKMVFSPLRLFPTVRNARELSERTNRTAIKYNNRKSP